MVETGKSLKQAAHEKIDHLFSLQEKLSCCPISSLSAAELLSSMVAMTELINKDLGMLRQTVENDLLRQFVPVQHSVDERGIGETLLSDMPANVWRTVVAEMMTVGIPLGHDSAMKLAGALNALNYGEVRPELKPTSTNKKGRASILAQLRLIAVLHTYNLKRQGMTLTAARNKVAEHFGCCQENGGNIVRQWESRELPRDFSKVELSTYKEGVVSRVPK